MGNIVEPDNANSPDGDGNKDPSKSANTDDPNSEVSDPNSDGSNSAGSQEGVPEEKDQGSSHMLRNFLIFSAFASVFILFACYICKKRRDEAANSRNSGSQ